MSVSASLFCCLFNDASSTSQAIHMTSCFHIAQGSDRTVEVVVLTTADLLRHAGFTGSPRFPEMSLAGDRGGGADFMFLFLVKNCIYTANDVLLTHDKYSRYGNANDFQNGCRSQWPPSLRRRSAAERLLASWVRIPLGTWMSVSCVCLCYQVEVSATRRSLVQRSPTECGVSECGCQASIIRRLWHTRGCCAIGNI
jgi:hypothetical protein